MVGIGRKNALQPRPLARDSSVEPRAKSAGTSPRAIGKAILVGDARSAQSDRLEQAAAAIFPRELAASTAPAFELERLASNTHRDPHTLLGVHAIDWNG